MSTSSINLPQEWFDNSHIKKMKKDQTESSDSESEQYSVNNSSPKIKEENYENTKLKSKSSTKINKNNIQLEPKSNQKFTKKKAEQIAKLKKKNKYGEN